MAELNRRSQACEVMTGTGFTSREMDEHQGSAPCIPVWKTGVYLSTLMLGEMESRAGIALPTGRDGFANRRLNCSANGIEIESAGGSFHLRLRRLPGLGVFEPFAIREQSSRLLSARTCRNQPRPTCRGRSGRRE